MPIIAARPRLELFMLFNCIFNVCVMKSMQQLPKIKFKIGHDKKQNYTALNFMQLLHSHCNTDVIIKDDNTKIRSAFMSNVW